MQACPGAVPRRSQGHAGGFNPRDPHSVLSDPNYFSRMYGRLWDDNYWVSGAPKGSVPLCQGRGQHPCMHQLAVACLEPRATALPWPAPHSRPAAMLDARVTEPSREAKDKDAGEGKEAEGEARDGKDKA
jgi:hypothetical protein